MPRTEREERSSTQNVTERYNKKRNDNGTIYLKSLVLEWNGTISKKSERAQPLLNPVPVIVRNPAYIEEVELDEEEVDPADILLLSVETLPLSLSQPRRTRT